jgi:hypothetical protein
MSSGNTLVIFHPFDSEPPATGYASLGLRNRHPVLNFDDTVQKAAVFGNVMPQNYSGGGVTVYLHWCAAAITGTVGWEVSFERIGDSQQDVDSDGFATAKTVTATTVPGTSGHVDITNVTFADGADMDSVAVGEAFRLKVARDVANDTAVGDAQLIAVEIKET